MRAVGAVAEQQAVDKERNIFREFALTSLLLGSSAALLIGFAKTGVPGAGMAAIALMAEAFRDNTQLSVGAMVPILILGDLFAIAYYRRHAQWNRLIELAPYVVAGMVPGYLVLWWTDSDVLRILIGTAILLLLALHLGRRHLGLEQVADRWWFTAMMGSLAGFGTVMGNAAGPAMSIYLVSKRFDKHEFIGTTAWFYFLVNVSKVPLHVAMGVITPVTLRFDLFVAPALVVGALVGAAVHKRIPQSLFNALVLSLAALAAAQLVLT